MSGKLVTKSAILTWSGFGLFYFDCNEPTHNIGEGAFGSNIWFWRRDATPAQNHVIFPEPKLNLAVSYEQAPSSVPFDDLRIKQLATVAERSPPHSASTAAVAL